MQNGESQQVTEHQPTENLSKETISITQIVRDLLQKFPRPTPPRWRVYTLLVCLGASIGALVWSGLTEKKVKKVEAVVVKHDQLTQELQLFLKRALVAIQRVEVQNQHLQEDVERLNVIVLTVDQRTEKLEMFIRNRLLEHQLH